MIFPYLRNICFYFYWLFLTHRRSLETSNEYSATQLKQLTALHRKGVCVYVWTRLHADSWDDDWTDKFFKWMQSVFYRSLKRQCTLNSQCPLVAQVKLIVRIDGQSNTRKQNIINRLEILDKNILWYMNRNEMEQQIRNVVSASNCAWVSYIYIDADDALLDGFFQHVTSSITERIIIDKKFWLGALFIPREIPQLTLGNDKCEVAEFKGYGGATSFFCGRSSGQGILLKRKVWDKLKKKVLPPFLHPWFLKVSRDFIMHGLGHSEYHSLSCTKPDHFRFTNKLDAAEVYERSDAAETGLLLIDLTNNWETSGILLRTPFSSHYPWSYSTEFSQCTEEQKAKIGKVFPKNVSWIIEVGDALHISMEEACKNNRYLVPGGLRNNSGCIELLGPQI